jgi:hypothetical protein
MALLSGVLIVGSSSLIGTGAKDDPEEALLAVLQKVRREAVERNQPIEVQIYESGTVLTWGENAGQTFTLPISETIQAKLLAAESLGAVLIGGQAEEKVLGYFKVYPDGTCDLFRLDVRRKGARRVFAIDPMTCAPLPGTDIQ